MPSVNLYFQVHQPDRLRPFSYFQITRDWRYFDDEVNAEIVQKVAQKCYLPANMLLLDLIRKFGDAFRVSFSLSGVALEQMQRWAPEALESFQQLAATGCVEFLSETYYHSLAALYNTEEFAYQVQKHRQAIEHFFRQRPTIFRNTELIYDDRIGQLAASMGFQGVVAEGADDILRWRSPNYCFRVPGTATALLLKNYGLADDIAFRFSNPNWSGYPLTAQKFAANLHQLPGDPQFVNLFMDYETFGEHQWASTGIFSFLEEFPGAMLQDPSWRFSTLSETVQDTFPVDELSFWRLTSWADAGRDASAWQGNNMQKSALSRIYALGKKLKERGDENLLHVWRKLQISDHFYYMSTKWSADAKVHAYFSPFDSPYDAFVNYMNVLEDFSRRNGAASALDSPRGW